MAKLIFLLDGNVIKEYALDKERMTIGRRASNDIQIDNLAISAEHAVILTTGEEASLEDLNSTNGTLVNEKKIKKHTLKHGDAIGLGKYQLKYLRDATVIRQQSDGFADTVLVQSQSLAGGVDTMADENVSAVEPTQVVSQTGADHVVEQQVDNESKNQAQTLSSAEATPTDSSSNAVEGEKAQAPRLKVLNGNDVGNTLLLDKTMVKVGNPGEQVAVVTKRQEGYFITHVAGDNFPMINGQPIGAQASALNNHDEIEVLGIKMEFCLD
jgi:pSer/pThr/pTyr-binding forkhead associated (FHA) protein